MKGPTMQNCSAIDPKWLSVLASVIAILIADDLGPDDLNVLGNFIVAVGSILLTIAAQEAAIIASQTATTQSDVITRQIDVLNRQVGLLQNKLGR